jgi:hypothetical protein
MAEPSAQRPTGAHGSKEITMAGTMVGRPAGRKSTATTRGFVALMLITAGALVLAGRALSIAGDALALVLGVELLCWAWTSRNDGPLITGGILTGVGAAILVVAGPLAGADPNVIGGAFVLLVAAGFGLVGVASRLLLGRWSSWALITAGVVGVIGAGVLLGGDVLSGLFDWVVPLGLLAGGIVAALAWGKVGRK